MSAMLRLADTYHFQGRYNEAENNQLLAIESLRKHGSRDDGLLLHARWALAKTWLRQGKGDESRDLALEIVALTLNLMGDQNKKYVKREAILRDCWGVNPDGTEVSRSDSEASNASDEELESEEWVDTGESVSAAQEVQDNSA